MTTYVDAPVGRGNDLRHYWDTLVSRWPLVVAVMMVGTLLAGTYLFLVPRTYTASTTLSVFPLTTDRFAVNRNIGNLVDMSAEAVTAASFLVALNASEETEGQWTAADLREGTTVSAGADSTTMVIRVEADSEERARTGAAAVADAYLQTRSDQAANSIEGLVERDQARVDEYRVDLADAIAQADAAEPGSTTAARALASQDILNQQISALLTRISSLQGIDTTGGVILNPASETRIAVSPSRSTVLAGGTAMGLLIGTCAAFLLPHGRRRVRKPRDIAHALEVETIAQIDGLSHVDEEIAIAAQRLLRTAARQRASVIAIISDGAVQWPEGLVDRLAAEMVASGTMTAVAPPSRVDRSDEMVLVPVGAMAATPERMHAMRISDASVIVAQIGKSQIRDIEKAADLADEMGAPVLVAILVSGKASPQELGFGDAVTSPVVGERGARALREGIRGQTDEPS